MRKIFSKGFFIGFLVTLLLVLILIITHNSFALLERGASLPIPITETIIASTGWAFLGGVMGRWLENIWNRGKRYRTIGFLMGTGFYFILTTLSALEQTRVLILVNLPGVLIFQDPDEAIWRWMILVVSWVTWGFIGWFGGFLAEKMTREI